MYVYLYHQNEINIINKFLNFLKLFKMKNSNATQTVKTVKNVKTPKVVAEPKAEKPVRVPIVVTLEQALKTKEEAQPMVGMICRFFMMGEAIERTGEVTTITHDKRNNRVFYRIFDADGKMFHKTVGSTGFKIDQEASMELSKQRAEAKAKADAAKAEIEKMIAEAKEAAKLAKEKLAEARKASFAIAK